MSMFKKASRKRVFLKIGLMGPSGSGKTYSGLLLARGLAEGGQIAVLDTENGSASLYANVTDFDVVDVRAPFHPKKAIEVINGAVSGGYKVLMIDSASHFWKQILEEKEALDRRGGNSYTNWGKVKPLFEEFKQAFLQAPIHIVCCMRAKDEYVLEKNDRGKEAPKKVGMGAILEPGAEYEYTTVFEVGMDHTVTASKDRTAMFDGEVFKITDETGRRFLAWLDSADTQEYASGPIPVTITNGAVAEEKAPDGKNAFGYVPVRWPLPKMFTDPATDSQYKMWASKCRERTLPEEDTTTIRALVLKAYGLEDDGSKAAMSLAIDWAINAEESSLDMAVAAAEAAAQDEPLDLEQI